MKLVIICGLILFLKINLNGETMSLRDFKYPETSASKLTSNLRFNLNEQDSIKMDAFTGLDYYKFYSSLPFSYTITSNSSLAYSDFEDITSGDIYSTTKPKSLLIYNNTIFNYMKYFDDKSNLFWNSINQIVISYVNKSNYTSNLIIRPTLGIGYGRIVDATAMAKALRVQEYLLSENLIKEEFSIDELTELANHLHKYSEYSTKYGDKHPIDFYMDLDKILVKTGKLIDNNFSPYVLLRINEVITRETNFFRAYGWTISAGITENNYSYFSQNFNKYSNNNELGLSLNFSLAYPISNKLQFNHSTNYSYSKLFILNDGNFYASNTNNNNISLNNSLTYELSNKIDISTNYNFFTNSSNSNSIFSNRFGFSFYYFIENNLNINLNLSLNHFKYSQSDFYRLNDRVTKNISLNLGYRFF